MATLTSTQFKRKAEARFKRANPGAADVVLTWGRAGTYKYADGSGTYRSAIATAAATGYRTRRVFASLDLATGALEVR